MPETQSSKEQNSAFLKRYYRVHSNMYDLTRWSFLFGRTALIKEIAQACSPEHILEVGCGTGKNLVQLCRAFPRATLTGIDLSEDMLAVARKNLGGLQDRVTLMPQIYDKALRPATPFDVVLFSYSLSMMNPGWDEALTFAGQDLAPEGIVAVVDFHDSRFSSFQWWMRVHHVRLDAHLLPQLQRLFQTQTTQIRSAYAGIWDYLIFLGQKKITVPL